MRNSFVYISILFLIALISISEGRAQQGIQYTQYMYDGTFINPAFAGTDGALSISVLHRDQWTGVKGAPQSQTLVAHTLFKKPQVGTGIYVHRESIGIHQNIQATLNFAYHVKLGPSSNLSFGLRAGLMNVQSDYQSLSGGNNDPNAINEAFNGNDLSAGFGLLYQNRFMKVSYSIPSLYNSSINITDRVRLDPISLNHLLFSQFDIPLNTKFKLHPGFLLRYINEVPTQYDLNFLTSYNESIYVGFSYRNKESVDLLLKLNLTPQLQIAYAYDYPIGEITNLTRGSNELLIRYIFKFKYNNVLTP